MKCVNHPEADSVGFCRQCGKALCGACRHEVKGAVYCEDCLAASVAPGAAAAATGKPSPGAAFWLGFIPGVGALYNGEYTKALVHFFIFAGLVTVLSSGEAGGVEPLFGLMLAGFIIYMAFEARDSAKRKAAGLAPASGTWGGLGGEQGTPIGPLILIVLGALFLMNTLDFFPFFYVWRFWPLVLILVGVWMLWKRTTPPPR
ncbi:MAG: B-box zinc finger protein [Candidatus Acidiferrales bacterium]